MLVTQFRTLLRIQMAATGRRMTGGGRRVKSIAAFSGAAGKIGMALLWGIAGVSFMMLFGMMFYVIAEPFSASGLGWLYMTLQLLMSVMFMLVGTVFLAKSQLFEARDNALLLSMPIPPAVVLLVRMTSLYIMNLIWGAMVFVPAMVCWILFAEFTVGTVLSSVVLFAAAALFALALSCLLGWGISLLSARIRNKTVITVAVSLAFIGIYYWVCGTGMTRLMTLLTEQTALVAQTLGAVAPLYHIGDAAANGSVTSLLYSLAVFLIPFAAVYLLLSRTFLATVTTARGGKKRVYTANAAQTRALSVPRTLLRRENTHLLSSAVYLLNAGIGLVFMAFGAGAVVWKRNELTLYLAMLGWDMTPAVFAAMICMMLSMTLFTAPSVSLEVKTLWQLRSMPVSSADILRAKWRLHLLWCAIPALLLSVVGIVFWCGGAPASGLLFDDPIMAESFAAMIPEVRITAADTVIGILTLLLLPQLFSAVTGGVGLLLGLRFPCLNWTNEAQVVKQSAAVLFSMFGNMALLVLPALTVWFGRALLPVSVWMLIWTAVFAVGVIVVHRMICGWGVRRFEEFIV